MSPRLDPYRLRRAVRAGWKNSCCLCLQSITSIRPPSSRRPPRLLQYHVKDVGYMITNAREGLSVHVNCLYYAADQKMIQDYSLPTEDQLEGFSVSSIRSCLARYKRQRCGYCGTVGACAECANSRCTGKRGWAHLPCALLNGSVLDSNSFMMYCPDHCPASLAPHSGQRKIKPDLIPSGAAQLELELEPLDWEEIAKEGEGEEDMEVVGDSEDTEMPFFDLLKNDLDLSSVSDDSDSRAGLCFFALGLDLHSDHCRGESRVFG